MTNKEAIKILKQRECCRECVANCTCNECDKAFEMAIEALKQEPCEDTISRKAVLETIDDCNSDGLKGIFCSYGDGERFKEYIKELPSVISKGVTVTDFADKCRECGKQKNGKWIPVSERMPNPGEYNRDVDRYYLVQNEYGDMLVARYAKKGYWEQIYQFGEIKEKIVAWLPLPKPYKAEMENEE